jgi:membrane associated rhomboid family serine protease
MNGFFEELKNAFKRPNNGLYRIILINIILFAVLIVLRVVLNLSGGGAIYDWIMSQLMMPADLGTFLQKPWTLITYMFTHMDFFHILFNLLFLYWFGQLIMEYLGSKKFVNIYVLGGLAGGITFLLMYNLLPYYQPMVPRSVLLGASAGVSAIIVAAATLHPNHSFFLMFIGPVKIKYIAIFWVVFKSFAGLDGPNAGGELAHLGGALMGWIYIVQLRRGPDIGAWVSGSLDWIGGLFNRSSRIKVSHRREKAYTSPRSTFRPQQQQQPSAQMKASQDEIDAILDKISAQGYESLSKEEKQKLFNASKKN